LADTQRSYCCHHTGKEWPNTYIPRYTHNKTKTQEKRGDKERKKEEKEKGKKEKGGKEGGK